MIYSIYKSVVHSYIAHGYSACIHARLKSHFAISFHRVSTIGAKKSQQLTVYSVLQEIRSVSTTHTCKQINRLNGKTVSVTVVLFLQPVHIRRPVSYLFELRFHYLIFTYFISFNTDLSKIVHIQHQQQQQGHQ